LLKSRPCGGLNRKPLYNGKEVNGKEVNGKEVNGKEVDQGFARKAQQEPEGARWRELKRQQRRKRSKR